MGAGRKRASANQKGQRAVKDCQDQQRNPGPLVDADANSEKTKAGGELKQDQGEVGEPQEQNDGNTSNGHRYQPFSP